MMAPKLLRDLARVFRAEMKLAPYFDEQQRLREEAREMDCLADATDDTDVFDRLRESAGAP